MGGTFVVKTAFVVPQTPNFSKGLRLVPGDKDFSAKMVLLYPGLGLASEKVAEKSAPLLDHRDRGWSRGCRPSARLLAPQHPTAAALKH